MDKSNKFRKGIGGKKEKVPSENKTSTLKTS